MQFPTSRGSNCWEELHFPRRPFLLPVVVTSGDFLSVSSFLLGTALVVLVLLFSSSSLCLRGGVLFSTTCICTNCYCPFLFSCYCFFRGFSFFLSFFLSVPSFLLEIALVLLVLLFSSASLWFRGGVCLVLLVLVLLLLFLSVFLLLFLSCFHWAWGYVLILSAPHIFRQCFRPLFVPCAHSSRGGSV